MTEKKTLYVSRPLQNADEFIEWAKEQGFPTTLPADDLHVTIAFSREPVDWTELTDSPDKLTFETGNRTVEPLGDKGAVVLKFEADELSLRWKEIIDDLGATWDHEGYHPHVTITYDAGDLDLSKIEPYTGPLVFGPERIEEVTENWEEDIVEKAEASGALSIFVPITKVDIAQRLVYGVLTEEVPDKAGEIIDYPSTKAQFQKWSDEIRQASGGKSLGNVRAMHGNVAAGKLTDLHYDDEARRIEGVAKIVDEDEWQKVVEGVYTGFSIGGGYVARWNDPANPALKRFTPKLAEVSIVDNPCVPTATFEVVKEDGSTELRKFNTAQEELSTMKDTNQEAGASGQNGAAATDNDQMTKNADRPQDKGGVTQGWQAKDGSFHLSKADAVAHNARVDADSVAAEKAAPVLAVLGKVDAALAKAEGNAEDEKETETESDEAAKAAETDEGKAATETDDEAETAQKTNTEDDAAKSAAAAGVKKGMYSVSCLADLLQSIQWLQQDTQWEAQFEGDNSELPAKLKAWLAEGAALLQSMVAEEVAELTAEKATGNGTLEKADSGELTKMTAERDALAKVLGDIAPKLEDVLKRVEHLEAQPAPAKGMKRSVSKAADAGAAEPGTTSQSPLDAINKHLAGMTPEQRSMTLMKAALANPVVVQG